MDERKARKSTAEDDLRRKRLLSLSSVNSRSTIESPARILNLQLAPLLIDWHKLYKTRAELDRRWLHDEPVTTRLSGHEDR